MVKNWVEPDKNPIRVRITYVRDKATSLTADEVDKVENEAKGVFPGEGWKRIRDRDLFVLENEAGDGWIARQ